MASSSKRQSKDQVKHPPYQDFADCSFEDVVEILKTPDTVTDAGENAGKPQRNRGGAKITFPMKLHNLLESLPDTETAIAWQHHGRAFKINDKERMANEILPTYFNYERGQFASFQRQLNIYEFMRITGGPDTGTYYHPLFLRSRSELCELMHRKVSETKGTRKSIDPMTEPDLCALPPLPQRS